MFRKFIDMIKRHSIIATIVATVLVLLMSLLFGSGNNLIHWIEAKKEIERNRRQIEIYQDDIDRMDAHINELKENKDSLESYAREQFNFSAPGEDVYVFDE